MNIFSCHDCVHAKMNEGTQEGCELNHLKAMGAFDITDGYFSLSRVCMDKSEVDEKKYVEIQLGYIFIIDGEKHIDEFKQNLETISTKNPIWVGIVHNAVNKINEILDIVRSTIPTVKFNVITNLNDNMDNFSKLDQFAKHYLNGWTLVNVVGEEFKSDTKEKLQKYIVEDLNVAGLIKDKDNESLNGACYYNLIYKFLKGSTPEYDDDNELILFKNFFERIEEKQSSMIKYWEDIN